MDGQCTVAFFMLDKKVAGFPRESCECPGSDIDSFQKRATVELKPDLRKPWRLRDLGTITVVDDMAVFVD